MSPRASPPFPLFVQTAPPTTKAIGPGSLVGERYRLERLLGVGGTAEVYRATHVGTGRAVAVKLLGPALLDDAVAVERFRREGRAAAQVGHPNIVEVLDVGIDSSRRPFLVTELLEGETLACYLARRPGPLPLQEAAALLLPILDGLAAAHEAGVVHRDLKPENVILHDAPGGRRIPKLVDFGISKVLRCRRVADASLTTPGAVFGTPYFISPEQAVCSGSVDARTDVWAAGVLLYRVLVGRVPFDARHVGALLSLVFESIPASPASLGVPPAVSRVIMHCLAKEREDRFPDARALKTALCAALGLPPDAASPRVPSLPTIRIAAEQPAAPTLRPPRPSITEGPRISIRVVPLHDKDLAPLVRAPSVPSPVRDSSRLRLVVATVVLACFGLGVAASRVLVACLQ